MNAVSVEIVLTDEQALLVYRIARDWVASELSYMPTHIGELVDFRDLRQAIYDLTSKAKALEIAGRYKHEEELGIADEYDPD